MNIKKTKYVIFYDLFEAESEDYDALIKILEKLGAKEIQLSCWYLESSYTIDIIFSILMKNFKRKDILFISEIVDYRHTDNLLEDID